MARSRVLGPAIFLAFGGLLCFSRLTTPAPEETPAPEAGITESRAAAAWLRAARRTAEGKKDSGAHWAAAWEATEAWWLRPVAMVVTSLFTCVAVLQQLPGAYLRALKPKKRAVKVQERSFSLEVQQELQCRKCLSALQRMELPVFGTSSTWSEKHQGVLVAVNLRGSPEAWAESAETVRLLLQEALLEAQVDLTEREVVVHLLREESYQLLVRYPKSRSPNMGATMLSLGAVLACSQWTTPLKVYDDPTVLGLCLALLLLSETAREMVAKAQNVALGARTFLPCPQLSLLGAFSGSGASPTKQDQLLLALAPSVVLMGLAVLLNAQDWFPGWTLELQKTTGLSPLLSPMAGETAVTSFLAAQAVLMASLALLPQSPQGRSAWAVLLGREKGEQLAEVVSYLYPFIAVFALWGGANVAVLSLPFTWQLLLTNVVPAEQPPPLEEVSEPSKLLKLSSLLLLLSAMVMVLPLP